MFYIGFADEHTARIGLARSRDGTTGWQRHPANPLISPTPGEWDGDACYKPFALFDDDRDRWLLWYNGRRGGSEQIGLAIHEGEDLGWGSAEAVHPALSGPVLQPETFKHYIDRFNALDEELYVQHVPNAAAWDFLRENVPLFECPDVVGAEGGAVFARDSADLQVTRCHLSGGWGRCLVAHDCAGLVARNCVFMHSMEATMFYHCPNLLVENSVFISPLITHLHVYNDAKEPASVTHCIFGENTRAKVHVCFLDLGPGTIEADNCFLHAVAGNGPAGHQE